MQPTTLVLRFETRLQQVVNYKNEARTWQGIADYSLSYESDDPIGTNLILVEAKKKGLLSTADGQLASYMVELVWNAVESEDADSD